MVKSCSLNKRRKRVGPTKETLNDTLCLIVAIYAQKRHNIAILEDKRSTLVTCQLNVCDA